jgi:uncharacterized membrane protein
MANSKSEHGETTTGKTLKPNHTHGEMTGVIAGEIVGAVVGSLAGPPGAVAGMLIGAAAGALAGEVVDQEAERAHVHDDELDDVIGVTHGDLGMVAAKPPSKKP